MMKEGRRKHFDSNLHPFAKMHRKLYTAQGPRVLYFADGDNQNLNQKITFIVAPWIASNFGDQSLRSGMISFL